MKSIIYKIISCLLLLAMFSPAFSQQEKSTTIIVVRHAEKELTGNDPALSAIGMERANKLAAKFSGIVPDAFYTTPYARTRQTLQPWAGQLGIAVKEYSPRDMPDFADSLKAMEGKTILVAGHSNTNPQLVNLLLGTQEYTNLDDTDYNTIYVVTITNGVATAKVVK